MTKTPKPPLTPSQRSDVAPFIAMDVLGTAAALEREGRSIIHLEVGEPGSPAPRLVREAAAVALSQGRIGYTEALGRPSLRARIARHYAETYGVELDPARIIVTTGSSGGFVLSFLALFDAGARVAVSAPGYPAYVNIFHALGIEPVMIEVNEASGFVVTADMIEAEDHRCKLDGVLLMSPANPSGTMMSDEQLQSVCDCCDRLNIAFISDEIYHGLTYERDATTALQYSSRAVIVNSFSKYYCMTGWRVGWLVVPDELVRPIERLQQNLSISVPYLSQVAAEVAFDARDELESVKQSYARNRALLLRELPQMGITKFHPVDGAFYVYCDIGHLTNDSITFCRSLLEKVGVAATPGLDFDRNRGHRMMRLSFAGSEADVAEGVKRLADFLRG